MKYVSLLKMYFKVVILNCLLALARADLLSLNRIPNVRNLEHFTGLRLVGGHDAEIGLYPYMVSMQCISPEVSLYFCGGSIIQSQWILTAAHCIKAYHTNCPKDSLYIRAGKHNIMKSEPNEQFVKIEKYIVHENYQIDERLPRDDVLLLKLERPLEINKYVRPVRLPKPSTEPEGNAVLTGWGFNNPEETIQPQILQTVEVPIISREECNASISILNPKLTSYLHDTNICTGPLDGGVAHCAGDSGGPLTTNVNGLEELVGIVSWGFKACGLKGGPSIYAKVSDYVDWIANQIAAN